MLDTVRLVIVATAKKQRFPAGWKCDRFNISESSRGWNVVNGFKHESTGLRTALINEGREIWVEVSLPRLIKPGAGNARLITTDKHIAQALRKMTALLRELFTLPVIPRFRFRRVDIAWQIRGSIKDFILAHWDLRHPEIDKCARIYVGESIYWLGDEMLIRMYDKRLKDKKMPGHIVRVEVELRKRKLDKEFPPEATVQNLTVAQCLRVLRKKLVQFQPRPVIRIKSRGDYLYHAMNEGWKIDGRAASDFILNSYQNKKSANRARKKLQSHKLEACEIDWRALVPREFPGLLLIDKASGCSYYPVPLP